MASITTGSDGARRLQFRTADRRRWTMYLGTMERRHADTFRIRVESLLNCKTTGMPIDGETARWLSEISPRYYDKLFDAGLVTDKANALITLKQLLDTYFGTLSVKKGTRTAYLQARRSLEERLGPTRPVRSITPLDADRWRRDLEDEGLAEPTISKRVKVVRQVFRQGIRWKMLSENPFEGVRAGIQTNDARRQHVSLETFGRVLDACPDQEWRVLLSLSRFGGLRCPSEHLALRWRDIDFAAGRIVVWSPKTARQGKPFRHVPLFPELRVELEALHELAEDGAEFVIARYRGCQTNLRSRLLDIIARAGVESWPRLYHNLRATRQTELCEQYPLTDVCRWLGNSPAVAARHYLMPQDRHFAAAAAQPTPIQPTQNPTSHAAERGRTGSQTQVGQAA